MKIKTVSVGYLETNCYIVNIEDECLIIDPGDEMDKIINEIENQLELLSRIIILIILEL